MTQDTMFPAIPGSPSTTITAILLDSETTVTVAELSCFPAVGTEGGNLCTLWSDTAFETCLYTAKSTSSGAGTLTIVRSGSYHASTSGGAIEWPAGSKIARNPTSYDHESFRLNIKDHETRLLAVEGIDVNWTEVTTTAQALAVNQAYITNNASRVVCTLPVTAAVGDVIRIIGKGAGGWQIAQNATQYIKIGNLSSTTGTGGYLQSTNLGDTLELVCGVANVGWRAISPNILDVI